MSYSVISDKGMVEVIEELVELMKRNPVFVFTIGNTLTANIPGITVAGANPELIKFTPPADVELLHYGECKVIPFPPATPDGKPTPALLTYTALRLTGIPFFVVDSGLIVKPNVPYISVEAPVGENIAEKPAMDFEKAKKSFELAKMLGEKFSKVADVVVIGESIPAGTTTAGAVLRSFGVKSAVSSSMPENPVKLKEEVIEKALERVERGELSPLEVVAEVGDPVILVASGIMCGCKNVVLAGGTQMAAVAHVALKMGFSGKAMIATTTYVADDSTADLKGISPIPVIASDPELDKSSKVGLKAYSEGFVKEGVGAGGATLLAKLRGFDFLKEVEKDYERVIESKLKAK